MSAMEEADPGKAEKPKPRGPAYALAKNPQRASSFDPSSIKHIRKETRHTKDPDVPQTINELTEGNLAALGSQESPKPRKKHDTMSLRSLTSTGGESSRTDIKKTKRKDSSKTAGMEPVQELKEFQDAMMILDSFGENSTLPRNFTFKSVENLSASTPNDEPSLRTLRHASSEDNLTKKKKKKPLDYTSTKVIRAAIAIQAHMRRYLSNKRYYGNTEKIRYTIMEIYEKERSYIEKLDILHQFYEVPLEQKAKSGDLIFDREQVQLMFGDIMKIKEAHMVILQNLDQKIRNWKPYYQISEIFPDFTKNFRPYYEAFTNNYSNIIILVRLANENAKIGAFLAQCKSNSKLKLNIQDILIMPIQQFPHYLTLLERLVHATPKVNPGRIKLEKVLQHIVSITTHLDSKLTEANNRHKVYTLQDQILNAPTLAIGDRMVVKEQSMAILLKGERVWRHIILFNDALMSLKLTKKRDVPYEFEWLQSLKESSPEEIRGSVKGTNYESPNHIAKKIKELEEKFGPAKADSPHKDEFKRTLRTRMSMFTNESEAELENLQALHDLNKGKEGLQVTFAEGGKVFTQTLIFETEDSRKIWLDDMKKYIQLCGPSKLSDRQIQQSSSKLLIWSLKKREKKSFEQVSFTIQNVSLNRLPSKQDPNVVNVVWAADVILINELGIRSLNHLVLLQDAILCALIPHENSPAQEYLLQWSYTLKKATMEVIPELVTEGNELVNVEHLRKRIEDLEKKIEVEQRILGGAQKMASGQGSNKLLFLSMKSASSETAENISELKNQLRILQKQYEISEACHGVWLRHPGDNSFRLVFSSPESRDNFISTVEAAQVDSAKRINKIKNDKILESQDNNSDSSINLLRNDSMLSYSSSLSSQTSLLHGNESFTSLPNLTASQGSLSKAPSSETLPKDAEPKKFRLYISRVKYPASTPEELSLEPGQEVKVNSKSSKRPWECSSKAGSGLVNGEHLIELSKYGLIKVPKNKEDFEVYVAISTPQDQDHKDALHFNIGDEITIMSKDLKGDRWLGKCGNKVGTLFSEGLFKL